MQPTTKNEFKDYCLRALGYPVIEIEVSEEQLDDRVDEALSFYYDYHFDATSKIYYKYQVQDSDFPGRVSDISVANGGTGYSNSDTVVITPVGNGSGATATLLTWANGMIRSVNVTAPGEAYHMTPNVSITTSTGSGATFSVYNGGCITMPENIIGVVRLGYNSFSSSDLFNIQYQIALNDLYNMTSVSMVPYYMAMEHLALITELLVGQQPIRYERHTNKLYLDMNWDKVKENRFIVVEAYKIIDPDEYSDVWKDRWLYRYCTQLIKKQWGGNLSKFNGIQMLGGVTFNGADLYQQAENEIKQMEDTMIMDFSLPVSDMVG